jgi:serine protease AprX
MTEKIDPKTGPSEGDWRRKLDKSIIAIPLLDEIEADALEFERLTGEAEEKPEEAKVGERKNFDLIIDLNLFYPEGRDAARAKVYLYIKRILVKLGVMGATRKQLPGAIKLGGDRLQGVKVFKSGLSDHYIFARLSAEVIFRLVELDQDNKPSAIYRIWPDFKLRAHINKTRSTVKADAAGISFGAGGQDIVWAVADSGVDEHHPHFGTHKNLILPGDGAQYNHIDFTVDDPDAGTPLVDVYGHGTHVAGIIGGEMEATPERPLRASFWRRDAHGDSESITGDLYEQRMAGMAPHCKLVSLKILDEEGLGETSNLIAAIGYVQQVNNYGRYLHIHGVNMSVGYDFDPEWFACGQSPLCVEVDRLVRSGVVVVVAAGNTGYGFLDTTARGVVAAGMDLTINDPGNAELAITVGSTHRDAPHKYGVSYFSSKGPTGDGRLKPDLVAPGEKVLSCAANKHQPSDEAGALDYFHYREDSGTSMAAPHVSGVIAAFLSVRSEFIGQPEKVKRIFMENATDLKRERYFQGYGLVDLMRSIQAV